MWGDSEIDELLCILNIIPDTIPCGLAKLVRRPCREVHLGFNQSPKCLLNVQQVFVQRRRFISDDSVYPEPELPKSRHSVKKTTSERYST